MFQDKLHCFPQFDPQSIVIHGVLEFMGKITGTPYIWRPEHVKTMLSCGLSLKATQSPLRLVLSGKLWESSGTVALTDREVMAMWRHTTKFNPSQIPNASYETTPWVPGLLSGSQCQTVVGWWVMSSGVVHYPSLSGIIISDTYVWIMIYIYTGDCGNSQKLTSIIRDEVLSLQSQLKLVR